MDDGNQKEFGPGEVSQRPPELDAWVVGGEPAGMIVISVKSEYAKSHAPYTPASGKRSRIWRRRKFSSSGW